MSKQQLESNINVNVKIRVRYAECDAQGVVFNARYADYADIAATEFIKVVAGSYQNLLDSGHDNQVVSLHIDWKASARFDDVLSLSVSLDHIGNTSFRLRTLCQKQTKDGDLEPLAEILTSYVVVSTDTYKKAPIPKFLLEQFRKSSVVNIDQAG